MAACLILIDVGGSSLKAGLTHLDTGSDLLTIFNHQHLDIDPTADRATIIQAFYDLMLLLLRDQEDLLIKGIALAFPGPADYQEGIPLLKGLKKYDALYGRSIFPDLEANLRLLVTLALANQRIQIATKLRICMENDARLYLLGAYEVVEPKPAGRLAFLSLGTGCGSAFMLNGTLLTSGNEESVAAGLTADGFVYHWPFKDSIVDDYLSTRGLIRHAEAQGLNINDGRSLSILADRGDRRAIAAFEGFGRDLSEFINDAAGLGRFRPERIYLAGRISQSHSLMKIRSSVPIVFLLDSKYPLIGCASLWRNRFNPSI